MTTHIPWMSINLLHNLVRSMQYLFTEEGIDLPTIAYKAKMKLHGSNCAIQIGADGFTCQSRTEILTPTHDYKGFARKVASEIDLFANVEKGTIVFGEWCGPGVEAGMAISAVSQKVFAIFAIQQGDLIHYEPNTIASILGTIPDWMHILPWEDINFTIDFASEESLASAADYLNTVVSALEKEDPWVKRTFGISGLGEGVVLYPASHTNPTSEALSQVMFKAKGEKHRTANAKVAVQVAPTVVAGTDAFVDLMVTTARLEQGLSAVGGRDPKNTGKFIQWVLADVHKESQDELQVSNLTWDQVKAGVQAKARTWFLAK